MMMLHEVVEKLLLEKGHPMTVIEIADELNKDGWYIRKNGLKITPAQISVVNDGNSELIGKGEPLSPEHGQRRLFAVYVEGRVYGRTRQHKVTVEAENSYDARQRAQRIVQHRLTTRVTGSKEVTRR